MDGGKRVFKIAGRILISEDKPCVTKKCFPLRKRKKWKNLNEKIA
jgi:hypothetical protein